MEYGKQPTAQSNLYPSAPSGEPNPPPYASIQSYPSGGMPYPQAPPQQPAYHQPYPSSNPQQPYSQAGYPSASQPYSQAGYPSASQPYSQAGYPSASQPYSQAGYPNPHSGPPPYGHPGPGSASCGQPQYTVVTSGYPQSAVVCQQSRVSMIGAIILSCFVFWCCGCLIGLFAFIVAMVGQSKSSEGNAQGAIQLRNASYGISIVGIIVGVILTIIFFVMRNH